MKFSIEIEVGNATMQTGFHVADALVKVADQLNDEVGDAPLTIEDGRLIRDENGNTVGAWDVRLGP